MLHRLEAERAHSLPVSNSVVDDVTARIEAEALTRTPEYAAAQVLVESLDQAGLLDAAKLEEFAGGGRFAEIIAALALMANMTAEAEALGE